jgi:DNA-binding transcriptional regulator YiaG
MKLIQKRKRNYRLWTSEEEQQLLDYAGVYKCADIAKKLKRSKYSVQKKIAHMNIKWKKYRNLHGVSPIDFATRLGVSVENVYYWVKNCELPVVELPKFMTIKNRDVFSILIDDEKLHEWLGKGWAYHPYINPNDTYYQIIIRNVRKKLDIEWISRDDIVRCLNITNKVLFYWQYRLGFPKPVFYVANLKINKIPRKSVIDWAKNNHKFVKHSMLPVLQSYGIGV